MKRLLALLLLLAWGCGSDGKITYPELPDPTPFHPPQELRVGVDDSVATIPVLVPVMLSWEPGGFVQFTWTLETPPGSTATLSNPTSPTPSFTPDLEGDYRAAVLTSVAGSPVEQASRRIVAASYLGQEACAECHEARAEGAAVNRHGTTLQFRAADLFDTPGCLNCHVLASNAAAPYPTPGSWDQEAEDTGFDLSSYVFTTYQVFRTQYPTLDERGSVQCESCHGPGSQHNSDPRRTNVSTDAAVCGTCHSSFGPRYQQWVFSPHSAPPPAATIDNPDCARCHTARAYARTIAGVPLREEGPLAPGVTCASCHNPHEGVNPSASRLFGDVDIAGEPFSAGRAANCVTCHRSEIADPAAHAAANLPFPCAIQAEMVAGRGAVGYGLEYDNSFHSDPGFKLRNFTGDPDDPLYAEACVTCHDAPTPSSGPLENRLGGHTFVLRSGSTELVIGNCDRCHPGLVTFDRNVGRDYDGNGTAEGVQTEVRGLLEILYAALEDADSGGGLSRPDGAGTPVVIDTDAAKTTAALRQAAFNYNFVVADGSFGVHNTVYAVQLLQRTWEQVTGESFSTTFPLAYRP